MSEYSVGFERGYKAKQALNFIDALVLMLLGTLGGLFWRFIADLVHRAIGAFS